MAREVIKVRKRATKPNAGQQATDIVRTDVVAESKATPIDGDQRRALIAEAAYYRSLRHASAGSDVENWLAAEREVDRSLMARNHQ